METTDSLTGETIIISADQIKFKSPRTISSMSIGAGELHEMAFPDRRSKNEWVSSVERKGQHIKLIAKPVEANYHLGAVHHHRMFGGACGLGLAAYVAQTYFTQEFPEIARSGALSDFIAYTQAIANVAKLDGCKHAEGESAALMAARLELERTLRPFGGSGPIWWDFGPQSGTAPNAFDFGHRVTVGVDGSDGQIYARVSLFSALNFGARLGTASSNSETHEVVTDIDPLAEHPPNDIKRTALRLASSRVRPPPEPSKALSAAIENGTQRKMLEDLLQRVTHHQLSKLSREMAATIALSQSLSMHEARARIEKAIEKQSQQVWRVVTNLIEEFRGEMVKDGLGRNVVILDLLVAVDANSPNGLSAPATEALGLAKAVLANQMEIDHAAGLLSEERIADLMGRGPGLALVAEAVLKLFSEIASSGTAG